MWGWQSLGRGWVKEKQMEQSPSEEWALASAEPANEPGTETPPGAPQAEPPASTRRAAMGRFRIRFLAERVVQAQDIRDALRQARSIRAIEVIAITRQE
jgi:hypothetical protein